MISWMQRHKKYLIITIWISTIAFVGAGFVGWGQYSYGDKAGAAAKVGDVEITIGELQKTYSNLYAQYNEMFQGNFDEEKAKSFGLQSQALKQLINQALVLNLGISYDLDVSEKEILERLKTKEFFFKDGVFDKEIYKQVLSRNNMTTKEYEADIKKELLIQKTLALLPVDVSKNELDIIENILNIADKIEYKVISDEKISVDTSDEVLMPYWEKNKQNFMSEVMYEVKFIKQPRVSGKYEDKEIREYYEENKINFKDTDAKILPFEGAKASVIAKLDAKETKDTALRAYIDYKKGTLAPDIEVTTTIISASNNPYNDEVLEAISKTSPTSPLLKPILVGDEYFTFELIKTIPSSVKSYEDAKDEILPKYVQEQKNNKLLELAKNSVKTFKGDSTDFITNQDANKIANLQETEANEFLNALFATDKKRGFIALNSGKIVLYNILEQKLLENSNNNPNNPIVRIKSDLFNEGLVKNLQNKYKTEIFIQGL
ncbi:peptidyl-prolyl cis-trans isomerase [Sulfurimonas hongkongensis]|uniref:Peptidyl-prolyl cis-trans isomerase n=1 Tax=Sulfurimonas hongkongensis TaxID=1172190 RepID=T0JQY2_9BACT|nr:peptidylprolyl isomerase [Sulfurimonas hongkongensis]EQB40581.1 peptidyl-prolyl cis-trans isomerase [Sulfurimonas hongkongensis]